MKKILSNSGGVKEIFHYNAHDDTAYIQTIQDVSGVLKHNQHARDTSTGHKKDIFNHKARIPVDVAKAWCIKQGIKYGDFLGKQDIMKRFLNDPDNKVWLTIPGRV